MFSSSLLSLLSLIWLFIFKCLLLDEWCFVIFGQFVWGFFFLPQNLRSTHFYLNELKNESGLESNRAGESKFSSNHVTRGTAWVLITETCSNALCSNADECCRKKKKTWIGPRRPLFYFPLWLAEMMRVPLFLSIKLKFCWKYIYFI